MSEELKHCRCMQSSVIQGILAQCWKVYSTRVPKPAGHDTIKLEDFWKGCMFFSCGFCADFYKTSDFRNCCSYSFNSVHRDARICTEKASLAMCLVLEPAQKPQERNTQSLQKSLIKLNTYLKAVNRISFFMTSLLHFFKCHVD